MDGVGSLPSQQMRTSKTELVVPKSITNAIWALLIMNSCQI